MLQTAHSNIAPTRPETSVGHDTFGLIADAAPVPMWVTALDGRRSFVNNAYVEFVGGDYATARDLDWRSIIHPDDMSRLLQESKRGEDGMTVFTLEGRYRRADGEWRWLRSVSQPRYDAAGAHSGYIGVAHDVTEARDAAAAVREREEQLRAFVNQTTAGFAQVDLTGRFTLVNDRFCEITGRSAAELTAMTMQAITHPDDLARNLELFEAAKVDGEPYTYEKRYIRPDGSAVWVSNSVALLRRADGTPHAVLATTLDITQRRMAEAALRRSEESVRLAIEGAGMATWELDLTTGRGRWSPNRFELLGMPRTADDVGDASGWLARIHPDDRAAAETALDRCIVAGEPYTIVYRIRRGDTGEQRWLQSHGSRVDDTDGQPSRFVGVSFDVTDRQESARRQQLLIDELNHRVKNTLAIVQGIAQQTFKGESAREAFEGRLRALSAAHNILTLTGWDDIGLRRVVGDTLAAHDSTGAINVDGPDIPIAPRTAVSLSLALHELATNAVKYGALSVPGGRVALGWSVIAGDAPRLALEWRESGGPAVVAPARRGFGTRMIERGLSAELSGTVAIAFRPDGVVCTVDAPLPRGDAA